MNSQEQSLIQSFMRQSRELIELKSVLHTLTWDQETMMPARAGPFRARQLSALSALYHHKLTSPDLGETLERLSTEELQLWPQAAVREMRREHEKAVKLPEELVRELAETTSLAYEAWVKARQKSDFSAFSPWLEKVLKLKQEEARCLQVSDSLYEALLDHYEPGMTVGKLDEFFAVIRPNLTSLLQKILSSSKQPKRIFSRESSPPHNRKPLTRRSQRDGLSMGCRKIGSIAPPFLFRTLSVGCENHHPLLGGRLRLLTFWHDP